MNIEESMANDTITVSVEGEIDGSNVNEFEAALHSAMEKAPDMIIDLKNLDYVSSAGLRAFLMIRKLTEAAGHTVTIKNVSEDVMDIFSVTGFVKLLNIES